MLRVQIGSDDRVDAQIDESWVTQQINRRRATRAPVCTRVSIQTSSLTLYLSTAGCSGGGGGGWVPDAQQQRIIDLWHKCGLDRTEYSGGNVIAFLRQLQSLL